LRGIKSPFYSLAKDLNIEVICIDMTYEELKGGIYGK